MRRENLHDHYFQKAKKENFSARSVYKLKDIQEKYKILKSPMHVLDLGAAPGSWSEYLADSLQDLSKAYSRRNLRTPGPRMLQKTSESALGNPEPSAAQKSSKSESVLVSLDIQPLSPAALERIRRSGIRFHYLQKSIFETCTFEDGPFDLIVSDMAPSTQGSRLVDCAGSGELIQAAWTLARSHLKQGGHFIVKVFQS